MEATSGKNPINHIGKIYNLLATQVAQDCVAKVDGIEEMYVRMLSQIGYPIDQPHVASAQILTKPGYDIKSIKPDVEGIIDECWRRPPPSPRRLSGGENSLPSNPSNIFGVVLTHE